MGYVGNEALLFYTEYSNGYLCQPSPCLNGSKFSFSTNLLLGTICEGDYCITLESVNSR